MTPAFLDRFSAQSADYAAYRPRYPAELFEYVASLTTAHDLAWDCATGNGQAAVGLAECFIRVVATDASAAQIAHAMAHERVAYQVGRAEASPLTAQSVDLVTVAQALHWLDLKPFYGEVRRVLKASGALAVWSYGDLVLEDAGIDAIVQRYNRETLASYWPVERASTGEGIRSLPFPFVEVRAPVFTLQAEWTLAEIAGYLRSWSATAAFVARHGRDPVADVERDVAALWGRSGSRRLISWPLVVRAGRHTGAE
ncbi:MAG: class I SAM-dependent methyltransferase [Gemmatimonadaceae bacterium]